MLQRYMKDTSLPSDYVNPIRSKREGNKCSGRYIAVAMTVSISEQSPEMASRSSIVMQGPSRSFTDLKMISLMTYIIQPFTTSFNDKSSLILRAR